MGLNCCVWNDVAVSKIAKLWGDICFLKKYNEPPLALKKVCIKTLKQYLIQEKIKLVVKEIEYDIGVRELSNSELEIIDSRETLDCYIPKISGESDDKIFHGGNNFEDDIQVNQEDDKEDGEISDNPSKKYYT
ncbi:unnamed protein product [Lactuca saligna]|uniref:Uncharacterized protein n=1 Tax=Lactuca saligna TaxID=75948 RepID=A0AA36DZZ5_LACSI|nr:unnamed protein product [Lactuca saligna]